MHSKKLGLLAATAVATLGATSMAQAVDTENKVSAKTSGKKGSKKKPRAQRLTFKIKTTAKDEADGCASHRHFGSVGETITFDKQFTPRRAGTVTARKGNGTRQQPHQRVKAQQLRHADTEGVLQQQQPHHHNQERPHDFTASP